MRDHDALAPFLEGRRSTPFAYDPTGLDCARFAAEAVEAQTGANPLDRLGHAWRTRTGALRVLRTLGGMAAAVDRVLERIEPGHARRGDIGGVPSEGGELLLVVVEGATLVGLAPSGLQRLPRSAMTCAWSAG